MLGTLPRTGLCLSVPNEWLYRQISRDPNLYRDPLAFNPERFLGDHPERNPRDVVFGFGRR